MYWQSIIKYYIENGNFNEIYSNKLNLEENYIIDLFRRKYNNDTKFIHDLFDKKTKIEYLESKFYSWQIDYVLKSLDKCDIMAKNFLYRYIADMEDKDLRLLVITDIVKSWARRFFNEI